MTLFRFTVGYEGTIEAPDPDSARLRASLSRLLDEAYRNDND